VIFKLDRGRLPLLVSVPHCGRELPPALSSRMVPRALEVEDTDWHVEKLYDFVKDLGASFLVPRFSRYVVDLNRPPEDLPMYAGANNTSICPTTFFNGEPLYLPEQIPDRSEIDERIKNYWQPYHGAIVAELTRLRDLHGYAILFDGHSICSKVPWLFDGSLPDLNLGTVDGSSCAPSLRGRCVDVLIGQMQFSHVIDGRFKGGYITRHYGRPTHRWHTVQMEMAWSSYLDESCPQRWDPVRADAAQRLLKGLLESLAQWRPD
jgi:N-formylglutamate deformylase